MSLKLTIASLLFASVLITACSKKDDKPPEITIKGISPVIVILNTPYSDAGATATDNVDGVLTVTSTGTVDTNFAGTYYITYHATDAAGNEAQTTRAVIVRNQAEIYNGNYNDMTIIGPDTFYYSSTSTISNIINNRVWLVGYSNDSAAVFYADLRHDTINIPHQIAKAGNLSLVHAMSGSGFIKTISDHTVFEISFTDSVSGNIYHGTSVYTKVN